ALPDLTTSLVDVRVGDCPGAGAIVARIGNAGNEIVPSANVEFYDQATGQSLGYVEADAILPGEYRDVTLDRDPPIAQDLTVRVVADDDGTGQGSIREGDETNNSCVATFT